MAPRHFLTLGDLSPAELHAVIDNAIALKAAHRAGREPPTMAGRVLGSP